MGDPGDFSTIGSATDLRPPGLSPTRLSGSHGESGPPELLTSAFHVCGAGWLPAELGLTVLCIRDRSLLYQQVAFSPECVSTWAPSASRLGGLSRKAALYFRARPRVNRSFLGPRFYIMFPRQAPGS